MYQWDWCEFVDGVFLFFVDDGEMGFHEMSRSVAPSFDDDEYVEERQVA